MTKFNFFLVVEALLLTLGLITIFNNDITSFIFILVLTLLAVRFFNKESKSDFVLTISLISLFLVSMWNIYVVLAILVGVAYVMINHFSQVKKKIKDRLLSDGIFQPAGRTLNLIQPHFVRLNVRVWLESGLGLVWNLSVIVMTLMISISSVSLGQM